MTDIPELFSSEGSLGAVSVDQNGSPITGVGARKFFVPLEELSSSVDLNVVKASNTKTDPVEKEAANAPLQDTFRARLAKVKRHTADISSQMKNK
jgi:hypothetical protein